MSCSGGRPIGTSFKTQHQSPLPTLQLTTPRQTALDRFIDQVADFALDRCLLSKLPTVFTPLVVAELSDDAVDGLLAASEAERTDRAREMDVLQVAHETLVDLFQNSNFAADLRM